jgi:DNA-binding NarL/FixJ family response regulator
VVFLRSRGSATLQVLKQMGLGKSNKEIGQIRHISEYTVKTHVKAILKKLNAIGLTEAIAIASQRGLINIGSVRRAVRNWFSDRLP